MDNAYATPVHARVERLYGRPVKVTSVYTALNRLEQKGYIASRAFDNWLDRGHHPKRYYVIAPIGESALLDSAETAARFLEDLC